MRMPFSVILLLLYGVSSFSQIHSVDRTIVRTETGVVKGVYLKNGIRSFKGIPYAAPPIGDLRWKDPQPARSWEGIRQCLNYGPSPMQQNPVPFYMWSEEFLIPKRPISEDCLYLNVWTGAKSAKEKRAVLVYIYGGGFTTGSGSVPIYDGEAMAKKGIIFVTFNYRVGIFGFLAHPELTQESSEKVSGNYGLLDQIAALKWVKQNIAAFGGNPDNVTIGGQSAGSASVVCLIASPLAKGLFKKAIAESGAGLLSRTPTNKLTLPNLNRAEADGLRVATTLEANSINKLRAMPATQLLKIRDQFGPVIDGNVLPESVPAIFKKHKQNDVNLLTGWNEDEGLIFGSLKKAVDFKQDIKKQYGDKANELLRYYPVDNDIQAGKSQIYLARDVVFGAQNYTLANIVSRQEKKVFVYRFTRKVPGTGQYAHFGAFHTGEVPYAYDNLKFVNRRWEPVDYLLANIMSTYWSNFVINGNPNGNGLSQWPNYKTGTKRIMNLGDQTKAIAIPDRKQLDFITNILTYDH